MRWLLVGLTLCLVLLASLGLAWWFSPAIVSKLEARLAAAAGLEHMSIEMARPGLTNWHIKSLTAETPGWRADLKNTQINYLVSELRAGQLNSIQVQTATFQVKPNQPTVDSGQSIDFSPAQLSTLPFGRLAIDVLKLQLPDKQSAHGHFLFENKRVSSILESADLLPGAMLIAQLQIDDAGQIQALIGKRAPQLSTGIVALSPADAPPAHALEVHGTLRSDSLSLNGELDLSEEAIATAAIILQQPSLAGQIQGSFRVETPLPLDLQQLQLELELQPQLALDHVRFSSSKVSIRHQPLTAAGWFFEVGDGRIQAQINGQSLDLSPFQISAQLDNLNTEDIYEGTGQLEFAGLSAVMTTQLHPSDKRAAVNLDIEGSLSENWLKDSLGWQAPYEVHRGEINSQAQISWSDGELGVQAQGKVSALDTNIGQWSASEVATNFDAEIGSTHLKIALENFSGLIRGAKLDSQIAGAAQLQTAMPTSFHQLELDSELTAKGRWQDIDFTSSNVQLSHQPGSKEPWHLRLSPATVSLELAQQALEINSFNLTSQWMFNKAAPFTKQTQISGTFDYHTASGPFDGFINLTDQSGKIDAQLEAQLEPATLDKWFNWQAPYAINDGELSAKITTLFNAKGISNKIQGQLSNGAASYDELAFEGLSTQFDLTTSTKNNLDTEPGNNNQRTNSSNNSSLRLSLDPLTLERVNLGVDVTNIVTKLVANANQAIVSDITAQALGGTLTVDTLTYNFDQASSEFPLRLEQISLAKLLELEGDDITGNGTLEGVLPIIITDNEVSIVNGKMRSLAPGGAIEVNAEYARAISQPGLDFSLRALENFEFDRLDADVDFDATGILATKIKLQGRNPEVEQGKRIHYNLNISQNILALLESLRLQDDVTRSIEQKVNRGISE